MGPAIQTRRIGLKPFITLVFFCRRLQRPLERWRATSGWSIATPVTITTPFSFTTPFVIDLPSLITVISTFLAILVNVPLTTPLRTLAFPPRLLLLLQLTTTVVAGFAIVIVLNFFFGWLLFGWLMIRGAVTTGLTVPHWITTIHVFLFRGLIDMLKQQSFYHIFVIFVIVWR
jgi:hypothetical protein